MAIPNRFLCFVSGHGSEWQAICTDLDIAVNGKSDREVRERIAHAIATYVTDAQKESAADRDRLLSRRAPWLVTAAWRLRVMMSAFRAGRREEQLAAFAVPCHG